MQMSGFFWHEGEAVRLSMVGSSIQTRKTRVRIVVRRTGLGVGRVMPGSMVGGLGKVENWTLGILR